ncbi:MAG: DNA mismatch repair protein MutS [Bacteroidetes bacterium]|nr:DNA mismatch repair protein MutS [Bacteroidota bacterium]MBK9482146.1 DNA mismatch repair protein MutS [Bacteroidota bacterium]
MAKSSSETPLMQQHNAIKRKYPDAILLFRVGDFYETFGQDAVITAKVLGITLTKRNNGNPDASELAGFPHHALDTYLHKLVKAGYRVAVCDQLEDPKLAKGIVKRGVTELVTPGTATNDKLLDNNTNNFLAAVYFTELTHGIAFVDISTGEFFCTEGNTEYIDKLLQSFRPSEVIFQKQKKRFFEENFGTKYYTYHLDEWIYTEQYATDTLLQHFQTISLKGFGIDDIPHAIIAAGAIIHYLKDTEHQQLGHISSIQRITRNDFLWMDRFTIQNLELLDSNRENGNTLLKVLDNTVSPMGSRMIKRWLMFPLQDIRKIDERLNTTEFFIKNQDVKQALTQLIKQIGDIERIVAKIPLRKISPREVLQLAKGLQAIVEVKELTKNCGDTWILRLSEQLNPCHLIKDKITKTLIENPPALANKGGLIAPNILAELDDLRKISSNSKEFLLQIQQREIEITGIPSLKISFNNVFGYYLEVTNTHKHKVPDTWIRKQTLANAERYITPELKEYEQKIMGAEEKILLLEMQIYDALLLELQEYITPIQLNANLIAQLDCITCFASNAMQFKYRRPQVVPEFELLIEEGRHPVIERNLPIGEDYVSNSVTLDKDEQQIIIITGPNMSGKSALLRQTVLITLMAHAGSFVPAQKAIIPLTDKIFTRVGASDNLSGGESTFMVEMNETASIINNISNRSLIVLDEIGRGTSTFDGISIAWSIAEFLHNHIHKPLTLFATHYHELNELENKMARIKNFHVTHKEVGNKIIFLRKLALGGSTHSFGLHVARMAGMPPSLVDRANEILAMLEEKNLNNKIGINLKKIPTQNFQLNIFDGLAEDLKRVKEILENVDINSLTPVEALMKLNELKSVVRSNS